jgi:uncharacterized membrane protein YhiD involved in acid resistance
MENFLFLAETEVNAAVVIINLLLVFALELVVAWVYRRTHRTLSYSQSFVGTIVLMGTIASLIMMVVTENIVGAFALLGAFSLIRFRTIVKETRDIAFVFFSLAIGVAIGTNNYTVAIVGTAVISAIILVLDRYNIGSASHGGYIVLIAAQPSFSPTTQAPWQTHAKNIRVLHAKSSGNQPREYTLALQLANPSAISSLVDALQKTSGVESVELLSGKDAVEY